MAENENLENELDEQEEQQEEKTFTQAEVDAIINKRLAKERKGQPSAEELSAFREWKAKQTPPDADKVTRDDLDSALAEVEMARRENYLLREGIDPEDVDYYVYRISKTMDGDTEFEDAAKEYFKTHKTRSPVRMDTGARLDGGKGGKKTLNEQMNDLIRNAK